MHCKYCTVYDYKQSSRVVQQGWLDGGYYWLRGNGPKQGTNLWWFCSNTAVSQSIQRVPFLHSIEKGDELVGRNTRDPEREAYTEAVGVFEGREAAAPLC